MPEAKRFLIPRSETIGVAPGGGQGFIPTFLSMKLRVNALL